MSRFIWYTLVAAAVMAGAALGQWGPRGCAAVAAPVRAQSVTTWQPDAVDADLVHWTVNGVWAGSYRRSTGIYTHHDGTKLYRGPNGLQATKPPERAPQSQAKPRGARPAGCKCPEPDCPCTWEKGCEAECHCAAFHAARESRRAAGVADDDPEAPVLDFGLGVKTRDGMTRYRLNGAEVDRAAVVKALGDWKLDDDSSKLHLTLIGPESDRKRALADLPQELRTAWRIQSYPADHWAVRDAGFITSGTPTIYLQDPAGKVLWRQDTFAAGDWTAVRKADPNYRPDQDPGPRPQPGPAPAPQPLPVQLPTWTPWAVLGGIVLLLLFRRNP